MLPIVSRECAVICICVKSFVATVTLHVIFSHQSNNAFQGVIFSDWSCIHLPYGKDPIQFDV